METKILIDNKQKELVEKLRREVFHLNNAGNYYLDRLFDCKLHVLATLDNEEIVAGLYFHCFEDSLMIEQVFVKESYQNTGLKLGRELIKELISRKQQLEEIHGKKLTICRIESQGKKSHELYKKSGFTESKIDEDSLYKRM